MNTKIRYRNTTFAIFCFCLLLSACAAKNDDLKRQAEANRTLGEAYMIQKNYAFALKALLESQKLNPEEPMVYYDLGLVYMAKERLDMAIENFQKAIQIKPNFAPAINALGNAYLRQKKWDTAIVQFDKLTDDLLYATPHYPFYGLGIAYFHKKEFGKAKSNFEEAIKLQPKFFEAFWWLGKTHLETGHITESRDALNEALEISPGFTPAYMILAQTFLLTGEVEEAGQAYRKVMEIAPGSPDAKQAEKELKQMKPSNL